MDLNAIRTARAAWTAIAEPGDRTALALIEEFGPVAALDIALGRSNEVPATVDASRLESARGQWAPRLAKDPEGTLFRSTHSDIFFLMPEDPAWPKALSELKGAPCGLWFRGNIDALSQSPMVAVTGSRDATLDGIKTTSRFVTALSSHGVNIINGGHSGNDSEAIRTALVAEMRPVVVYPAGLDDLDQLRNGDLLREVIDQLGTVVSELPPGMTWNRHRMLSRNKIVAALGSATLITEARTVSAAISVAEAARALDRPVGAVPGSIFSANSGGTNELIRRGWASMITSTELALDLAGVPRER